MHTGEVQIYIINSSSWNVTFIATALTERWDENYYLTSEYDSSSVTLVSPQSVANFDLVLDNTSGSNPMVALGKYKISAIEDRVERAYFYMDWRSSDDVYWCPDVFFNMIIQINILETMKIPKQLMELHKLGGILLVMLNI